MQKTAVVILNWNGQEHLKRFLPSVTATVGDGAGIFVADNGSDDHSLSLLARDFPGVGVIKLDRNHGFAEGYNRALADPVLEGTEYFVLLNSDVETPSGWLEPLVEALDSDPNLAAAAPKILSYKHKTRFEYAGAAGGFIDKLGYPFCRGRILGRVEKDHCQYDDPREVFWASGACMAVRAEVFRRLGGLDGDFFAHMEEIDFCWRAQLAGYRINVIPASAVYHLGGGTLGADNPRKLYLNYRNNLSMMYKNLGRKERRRRITLRMIADGFSATVYLITLRWKAYRAVVDAHRDFRKSRALLQNKRDAFAEALEGPEIYKPFTSLVGVYNGSIVMRYIFGRRKFGDML